MQFSVVSVFALLAAAVSAAPANSLYEDALAQVESAFPTVDSAVQTVAAQGYAEALSILNLDLSNATSVVSSLVTRTDGDGKCCTYCPDCRAAVLTLGWCCVN